MMVRAIACVLGMTICLGSLDAQVPLADLNLSDERLPQGCALSSSSPVTGDGRVRANPWIGSEPVVIAAIRERIEPLSDAPDGPPLSARERARFRLRLADGVEQAYAAIYRDEFDRPIVVYGLKFVNNPKIVAKVSGDGECAAAVAAHVASVLRR